MRRSNFFMARIYSIPKFKSTLFYKKIYPAEKTAQKKLKKTKKNA
jgi:hypothetical protein